MWCSTCRKTVEIPPEVAGEQAQCPVCTGTLTDSRLQKQPSSVSSKSGEGEALKLLERWSDQRMFSPEGDIPQLKKSSPLGKPATDELESEVSSRPEKQIPSEKPISIARSIAAGSVAAESTRGELSTAKPNRTETFETKPESRPSISVVNPVRSNHPADKLPQPLKIHSPLTPSPTTAHFDVQAAIREQLMTQERSWISAIGYLFSYGGIALLTAGAGLTLWSFYDQSLNNIPREWLVTTVGQIFLFAGIVMLVSLIVERIGNRILFRISQIDDRITRIERVLTSAYETQKSSSTQNAQETKPLDVRKAG